MIQLAGYLVGECIYQGLHTLVYRALNQANKQPVVIKTLQSDMPSSSELSRLRHDYDIGQQFNDEHIVQYLDLQTVDHKLALIIEDFSAISLEEYLGGKALPLREFIQLAIAMAQALAVIHDNNIIHKDIKPDNILIDPDTKRIKVTDFGLAVGLTNEVQQAVNPEQLEGSLSYISPEQTGRMNRCIDYRSDFYSLGITYYKMLTGRLPFFSDDAMELVHHHLATTAVQPQDINPNIPASLAALIMTLLAKNAEDRYQSARGIVIDLEKMQTMLHGNRNGNPQGNGNINIFQLRQQDVSGIFHIPQKLYGREQELAALMASFESVSKGAAEMMLLAGYSGVGKSSLVQELQKEVIGRRGYFITGKFDQYKRNEPYYAFILAFRELIKQLLTESVHQLILWKQNLLSALGINGQVIIDVIPEMEWIIGKQAPVEKLDPGATQRRFHTVFGDFICALAASEHPLAMFIDDLQWADSPSLDLMKNILLDSQLGYLLLIGAYRDNEVNQSYPLTALLAALTKVKSPVHTLTLPPLSPENLSQLIADTLQKDQSQVASLSRLVMEKTDGNPFFVNEVLNNLHRENLIKFDSILMNWSWDIVEVESTDISHNVVDLMIRKIQKLPEDTRQAISMAACLGARFNLWTLALLTDSSIIELARTLWPAVEDGIIVPKDKGHKLLSQAKQLNPDINALKPVDHFRHDHIQQAAYEIIPPQERIPVHLKIGRLLLEKYSQQELDENLFYITEQFNQGKSLITSKAEIRRLVELNIEAAKRAKGSSAYSPAFNYASVALELLPKNSWQDEYPLALLVYTEVMELSFLIGDYPKMQSTFDVLLNNTKIVTDQVKAYETKINYHTLVYQPKQAVEVALEILAKLGIKLPSQPSSARVMMSIIKVKLAVRSRSVEDFINLPELQKPAIKAAIRILMDMIPSTYIVSQNLLALAALEGVRLSIIQGLCAESAVHFSAYSVFTAGGLGWIDEGYAYGKLALKMMDKFDQKEITMLVEATYYIFISHWKKTYRCCIKPMEINVSRSYDLGSFEQLEPFAWGTTCLMFLAGRPIPALLETYEKYDQIVTKVRPESGNYYLRAFYQMIQNLSEMNDDPVMLMGEKFDESLMIDEMKADQNHSGIINAYTCIGYLGYLFGRQDRAFTALESMTQKLDAGVSSPMLPAFFMYRALTCCAALPEATRREKKLFRLRIKQSIKKLIKFARHNPNNVANKRDLVLAEWERIKGHDRQAMGLYERSIESAQAEGFIHEEALANELYGKFWLSQKRQLIAKTFINKAYYLYHRWGALAKCTAMLGEHSDLIGSSKIEIEDSPASIDSVSWDKQQAGNLDLTSALKASHTISGEIDLGKLLSRLMNIIIENAGARSGHLILERDNQLRLEASVRAGKEDVVVLQSIPFDESQSLEPGIVRYVIRCGEDLILDDASNHGLFTTSPYISKNKSKSILCIPIRHQNNLQGLLYLENELVTGAFTQQRIDLLRVVLAQAAISIVNARLYANLEAKVEERTQALHNTMNQLIEAEKIAALGQVVAGVAHELNTPIGIGITSSSHWEELIISLTDKYKSDSMTINDFEDFLTQSREVVTLVLNSMQRAGSLVERFKTTAVNQSGEKKQTFKLKGSISNILSSLTEQLQEHHHKITVNCHDHIEMEGYPLAFALVISNLLTNSITHGFKGGGNGQITLNVSEQKDIKGEYIKIEYHDNGVGIDEDDLKKIFEPFFTTSMGTNTGLGLHIVYNIITQQFDGNIHCESKINSGTDFYISLPSKPVN